MLAQTSRQSPVLRNFIGLIVGVLLHYLLLISSCRLAWLLIVERRNMVYKDAVINWMLCRTFAIDPAVAVVVGGSVAFIVRRAQWWLGGVATLPLLIYVSVRADDRIEIGSSVVYMILALGAAYLVSRFKRMRAA
jgi:hypothetical protein